MTRDPASRRLLEELWDRDARYYELARDHVRQAAAAGNEYRFIDRHLPGRGRILEVGCGEGSNIAVLSKPGRIFFGCDLSTLAIAIARRQGGEHARRLVAGDAGALPFAAGSFDAVIAISVIEHLPDPAQVIGEMIGALAPKGRLILVSPQYGGPLGASPCRRTGGASRFVRRLLASHLPAGARDRLDWDRVDPAVFDGVGYEGDRDVVVEPELRSLLRFLEGRELAIVAATSGFEWHRWTGGTLAQRIARRAIEPLGVAGIPPYRGFGPLIAVVAERPTG